MKSMISVVALAVLVACQQESYSTFGISRSADVVMEDLAGAVNTFLGGVKYLRCSDVSERVSIFPVHPEITLTRIQIEGLKVAVPLDPTQLSYAVDGSSWTVEGKDLKLGLEAGASVYWFYKVNGLVLYRGTYTAKLASTSPKLHFLFVNGKLNVDASIQFDWTLSESEIKGFGATKFVTQHIEELFYKTVGKEINADLNKYNDAIVARLVYGTMYRQFALPDLPDPPSDKVSLINRFADLFLIEKGGKNYMNFQFASALYYAIEHKEVPLTGTFKRFDEEAQNLALYFGSGSFLQLLTEILSKKAKSPFIIDPEKQKDILGHSISISFLSHFYPPLMNIYNTRDLVDFVCTEKASQISTDFQYILDLDCNFVLHNKPTMKIFTMPNTQVSGKVVFNSPEEERKSMTVGLGGFKFTRLEVSNPPLHRMANEQFKVFMQPLSTFWDSLIQLPTQIVPATESWAFSKLSVNSDGDAIFYYSRKA